MTLRHHLRTATRAEHDRVDALGERYDLTSADGYGNFLLAHARALPSLEAAVGTSDQRPQDWPDRRRTPALLADLARLGLTPPAPLAAPDLPRQAMGLGALYVLEGSRLGGAVLRRRLKEAQPEAPDGYLSHGDGRPLWRSFLDWLEDQEIGPAAFDDAVAGARHAFGHFERALSSAPVDTAGASTIP
ncbi:MAG: biliverdin-producing heme oxygenase [Caulobacteraceae bacterium]|nr:biliverdin-producing heme oxygenase [Caulobacteraceae bacterium]